MSTALAGLAEIFFCLTVAIALFTSPAWIQGDNTDPDRRAADGTLRRLATTTTVLVYGQILIGAAMRHTGAGLAIPDFPLMFGGIVPDHWTPAIAVHFAHRLGAVIVSAFVVTTVSLVLARRPQRRDLTRPALILVALVAIQVTLGALTVVSRRDPWINSFHVVCGALVLATSLVITLRTWRVKFAAASDRLKPATTEDYVGGVRIGSDQSVGSVRLLPDHRGQA